MASRTLSIRTSSSGSHTQRQNGSLPISKQELKPLHDYLEGDFQNYWDIRRCGDSIGFRRINCPCCPYDPKLSARVGEDFAWYNYRKYKAVMAHMVDAHLKKLALTNRRILAEQARREAKKKPTSPHERHVMETEPIMANSKKV